MPIGQPAKIAEAILALSDCASLRESYVNTGLKLAANRTYAKLAADVAKVYQEVWQS